jgi:DnaJ-domain-containing protein 1
MTRLSDGKFGPSGKKLADLSDDELLQERADRQGDRVPVHSKPSWKRVRQYLANLELSPGATWPEIERAYKRLRERYSPEKHKGHPERHEAAQELNNSLMNAYEALRAYFRQE